MLIGDSNTGWTSGQALRVANAVKDIDVFIEQPCPTYRCCEQRHFKRAMIERFLGSDRA